MTTERLLDRVDLDRLREIGLFGGLDDETLRVLSQQLPQEDVAVGAKIVTEGEQAR